MQRYRDWPPSTSRVILERDTTEAVECVSNLAISFMAAPVQAAASVVCALPSQTGGLGRSPTGENRLQSETARDGCGPRGARLIRWRASDGMPAAREAAGQTVAGVRVLQTDHGARRRRVRGEYKKGALAAP